MVLNFLPYATVRTDKDKKSLALYKTYYPLIYLFFLLVVESASPVLDSYCLLTHKGLTGDDEFMSSHMNVYNLTSLILG